jgi:hypothetical protein
MKIKKFQLRGKNSVCAGAFQLLCGHAPAQLRGNNALQTAVILKKKTADHLEFSQGHVGFIY